jgi:hypothetical protein
MTDTGTESLLHYDVEVTPISSINYAELKKATIDALKQFQTECRENLPGEFTTYLDALMGEIDSTHKAHDLHIASSSSSSSSFKPIPKPVSQQMNNKVVNNFISNHKDDAVFLVTGGSFNPPHNGHIRMFETAYNQLMTITANTGKKVYGVMVPAPNAHIENKICNELKASGCSNPAVIDAIKLKRIEMPNRIKLCTLSCNSFNWADKTKFGPSNMIVVNESSGEQGETVVAMSPINTYYLCGSDYYVKAKDSKNKFIFITRNGDKIETDKKSFTLKEAKSVTNVKADDIMIPGNEDDDSEASSSRLRTILDNLKSVEPGDDGSLDILNEPIGKKLLTKEVYCELLKTGYIVGNPKGIRYAELLGCNDHHDDDDENQDKPANYLSTGLINGGKNHCYFNAAFQLLFSAQGLREWISANNDSLTKENLIQVNAAQMLKLMIDASKSGKKKTVEDTIYKDNLAYMLFERKDKEEKDAQQDSSEVLIRVLDAFTSDKNLQGAVESLKFREFVFNTKTGSHVTDVPDNAEKCITGLIAISDANINSIQTALDAYTNTVSKLSDTLSSQTQIQFDDKNRYFLIYLNRTTGSGSGMNKKKIIVDRQITVTQTYNTEGRKLSSQTTYKFKLRGAILKSGNASGGHFKYISYENGPDKPITYNDRSVYESKDEELTGEISIENNSFLFLYEKDDTKK